MDIFVKSVWFSFGPSSFVFSLQTWGFADLSSIFYTTCCSCAITASAHVTAPGAQTIAANEFMPLSPSPLRDGEESCNIVELSRAWDLYLHGCKAFFLFRIYSEVQKSKIRATLIPIKACKCSGQQQVYTVGSILQDPVCCSHGLLKPLCQE